MNNPQYLAQVGHTLGGALTLILTALFFGPHAVRIAWDALLIASALKEFWYDMRYEIPKQTWKDSGMDFAFYHVGAGLAAMIVWYAHHLGRL